MPDADPRSDLPIADGHRSAEPVAPTPELCRQLAARIHDDVLQSLALCSLQAELSRCLWESGEPEQALRELSGIGDGLEAAAGALRDVMSALVAAAAFDQPPR